MTEVEYTFDNNDHSSAKRALLDRLAIDGYVNSEIITISTETATKKPGSRNADINEYLPGPRSFGYMYGYFP